MSRLQLSLEDIRGLAKLERDMDSGAQPFVLCDGNRYCFPADVLEHLGVESGQTVPNFLLCEIMEVNILNLERRRERIEAEDNGN